jgi:hypothetical protein
LAFNPAAFPAFTPPPPPPACREGNGPTTEPSRPGAAIVYEDTFECGFGMEDHGSLVTRSVRSTGFHGQIQRQLLHRQEMKGLGVHEPNLSPAETRKRIEQEAQQMVTHSLQGFTEALNHQSRAGVKNSAVNFSSGLNKADVLQNLEKQLAKNPDALDNAARAFGVDLQKLRSGDPKVSGPELRKLQQGLLDSINRGLDGNPEVNKAKKDYEQAVRRFESNHNSVVVSVGNTGGREHELAPGLKFPADFQKSFNINDQVTPVGSSLPGLGRMGYSSNERKNTIYTDGNAPRDNLPFPGQQAEYGTSFAAPRVTALLAEIHRRYPKLTHQQAENLLRQQLTNHSHGYTEVDPQKSQRFLAEG